MEETNEVTPNYRIHITTTITTEMLNNAKKAAVPIKMSEALRVGIGVLLAEQGDDRYTGALNVYRKLNQLRNMLEETSHRLDSITNETNNRAH